MPSPRPDGASIKKIVLGFDGSEEARDAARLAGALARAEGAEVVAVVVNYSYPLLRVTAIERDRSLIADAARLFDEAERELEEVPITTRTAAASSPARALHDIADDEGLT